MITLAYFSSASHVMSLDELSAILAQAQQNNSALGITGLLCHYDGSFLQFLEGDAAVVDPLFSRIASDRRHKHVLQAYRAAILTRAFADWSMALVGPDDVSPAQRAFVHHLRTIDLPTSDARPELAGLLRAFRSWMR